MDMKPEEQEEGPRFPPPSQEQVAYRALCLTGLVMCAVLDDLERKTLSVKAWTPDELERLRGSAQPVITWMDEERIADHLSREERRLMAAPIGQWAEQAFTNATWREEPLGVLLWALSVIPSLPPYDTQFDLQEGNLIRARAAADFLASARLRPKEEISRARDVAELWHWRSRTTHLQHMKEPLPRDLPGEMNTYEKIVRVTVEQAHRNGDIPPPIRHDFPAFGKPYPRLTDEEYSICTSIAMERHYALNWLCGYAEDWNNVPTDT